MVVGYHHFWKHPCIVIYLVINVEDFPRFSLVKMATNFRGLKGSPDRLGGQ